MIFNKNKIKNTVKEIFNFGNGSESGTLNLSDTQTRSQNKFGTAVRRTAGFTLIEMIVVLAIFGILSAVILFNYGQFNSSIILQNTAYEMALQIREAQTLSLGVRSAGNDNDYDIKYGSYFNIKDSEGNNKQFIFFSDLNRDGVCDGYNGSGNCMACIPGDECISNFQIKNNIYISEICATNGVDGVDIFNDDGSCVDPEASLVDALTITFDRPDPDAIIQNASTSDSYNSVGIMLKTSAGDDSLSEAVIIRSTGQISVGQE